MYTSTPTSIHAHAPTYMFISISKDREYIHYHEVKLHKQTSESTFIEQPENETLQNYYSRLQKSVQPSGPGEVSSPEAYKILVQKIDYVSAARGCLDVQEK